MKTVGFRAKFAAAVMVLAASVAQAGTLSTVTDQVYFDIEIDGEPEGRIVFGLFGDVVPKTVKNFTTLAEGNSGRTSDGRHELAYAGSSFHRIITDFMAQGGDFTRGDGRGGESIYGSSFADESFELSHSKPYLLSMANSGPDSNGSQFFITFKPTSWLNGKHVVFGEVMSGFEVVDALEAIGSSSGTPSKKATIAKCGTIELILEPTNTAASLVNDAGSTSDDKRSISHDAEESEESMLDMFRNSIKLEQEQIDAAEGFSAF